MPDPHHNAALNDLLIQVYRSLLQYTVECWPWSDPDAEAEQEVISQMAAEQREVVANIAALLDHRQQTVDFGTYPDWSELHFVSLDYLLGKLIDDEEQLNAAIERAQPGLKPDPQGSALAFDLLYGEQKHLARLRELSTKRKLVAVAR
ncbi:MAG: hypothetical protein EXS05_13950 [Planctomycetaceae bacterium]|nr:hypothetical protein [Planctomycetaceae bacterium]